MVFESKTGLDALRYLRDGMDKKVSIGWIGTEGNATRTASVGKSCGFGGIRPNSLSSFRVTIRSDSNNFSVCTSTNQNGVVPVHLAFVSVLSRRNGGTPNRLRFAARNDLGGRYQTG